MKSICSKHLANTAENRAFDRAIIKLLSLETDEAIYGSSEEIGEQDEKYYVEFSPHRLAKLGISQNAVISAIQQQNARYQRVADFETMIRQTFLPPQRIAAAPQSPMMPLADIIDLLERRYPTFRRTRGINERLGRVLTQMGYEKSHKTGGASYYIRLIE